MGEELDCRSRQVGLASQRGRHDDRSPAVWFHISIRHFSSALPPSPRPSPPTPTHLARLHRHHGIPSKAHVPSLTTDLSKTPHSHPRMHDRNIPTFDDDDAIESLSKVLPG